MLKCPHCDMELVEFYPRRQKAKQLADFLIKEFKILEKNPYPAEGLARLAIKALKNGYQSVYTARRDRLYSIWRYFHAYCEGLKPYGDKPRRAGKYRDWMQYKYGKKVFDLLCDTESFYKELSNEQGLLQGRVQVSTTRKSSN